VGNDQPRPFEVRAQTVERGFRSFYVVPLVRRKEDDAETVEVIRGVVLDVSERVELESHLRHTQRMEALGKIAAGVAHDFNNLLTVILCNAAVLENEHDAELALEVSNVARSAADLTRRLLTFSRQAVLDPRWVDVRSALGDCMKIVHRTVGDDVRVTQRIELDAPGVVVDPGQLEQVVLNLAINSRDAMPRGGELVVEAYNTDIGSKAAARHGVAPGRFVVVGVRDTGTGIEPSMLPRIFEPFFTTKPPGHGTGLGLSTVYGAAKQAGGFVEVESELGKGTQLRVYFPVADAPELELRADVEPASAERRARVLLVEDDAKLARVLARMLRAGGHEVKVTTHPSDALAVFDQARDGDEGFTVLVTDYLMPSMNGVELAKRLRADAPELPVLLLSGWGFSMSAASELPGVEILNKPLSGEDLRAAVERLGAQI
jgi:signal transduction histidine kinase/ActR/RegA family two-component response regulator